MYNIKILEVGGRESRRNRGYGVDGKSRESKTSIGHSQIKDESPSFKLDSKRMIGRSRLFKYTGNEEDDQLPKFNFTPTK